MAFYNRIDEVAALDDLWTSEQAEFFVLWGRRRVGKTELLSHWSNGKRGLYFEATDVARTEQLRDLSHELATASGNQLLAVQPVETWDAALIAIEQYVGDQRTVIILDEFQFLAKQEGGLGSTINRWWRTKGRYLPIVLVLAGSEVGFFEREVLGGQMYGRRTGQLQLLPFEYKASSLFHPSYSPEDKLRAYAVCGGMPYYLERFHDQKPLREHVLEHVLYRSGFLHEEADLLLRQELPDPRNYMTVLRAIAQGCNENNQIVQRTKILQPNVTKIITTLKNMQLVRALRPVTSSANSKKTTYEIVDGFLNFYFRFVDGHKSKMRTRDQTEVYLDEIVMPQLDHFVSKGAWERVCQEYVNKQEKAAATGSWWGQIPTGEARKTRSQEIDIVSLDHSGQVLATGSCKWTNGDLTIGEENLLNDTEPHIPKAHQVARHYFCAREGFDKKLETLAKKEPTRIKLVRPSDLYRSL